MTHPRYPIYIPSKGRAAVKRTAACLVAAGIPFWLVVEPQEADLYAQCWGRDRLLITDFSNAGQGVSSARNFIHDHARASGAARHWQIDDDIRRFRRLHRGRRITAAAGPVLTAIEDFTDRYTNVAQSGPTTVALTSPTRFAYAPFTRNHRIYSCILQKTDVPFRWRGPYNEDTDMSLQCLAAGWCTILTNALLIEIDPTFSHKGGMTTEYYSGDGRLKMARSLERRWPGVVDVSRRWDRPQHVIKHAYHHFDTPLQLRDDVDLAQLPAVNNYGMRLVAKDTVRHPDLLTRYAKDLA